MKADTGITDARGVFSVSLDFELHWGGFEKWPLHLNGDTSSASAPGKTGQTYNEYFLNTRRAIPEMLLLFEQFSVHVTWATVGMLFHDSKEELLLHAPALKPSYRSKYLSAYEYMANEGIGENEDVDPFHFSPSIIRKILATPFQELGTHTFAHYYCNEEGQTHEQFREDLKSAQRAAQKYGVVLRSLVFPRNQFNDEYLRVCFEEGIQAVRSNPLDWFWKIGSTERESGWKRLNRGLDAYIPIGKKSTYTLSEISSGGDLPICLPASRLLRPYHPAELILNSLKVTRIKNEMSAAAEKGEVYHLWWHPHNFGNYPVQSLDALRRILEHYNYCRDEFGMCSMNMGEIATAKLS